MRDAFIYNRNDDPYLYVAVLYVFGVVSDYRTLSSDPGDHKYMGVVSRLNSNKTSANTILARPNVNLTRLDFT